MDTLYIQVEFTSLHGFSCVSKVGDEDIPPKRSALVYNGLHECQSEAVDENSMSLSRQVVMWATGARAVPSALVVDHEADEDRSVSRPILRGALSDADLMLSYAAHRGISLEKDVVEKLVTAITAQPDTLTSQQELDFWLAQTALSKAIVPVDSESLKCAATTSGKPSPADAAARRYRWYTIVTLVLLLAFQIYWLIGATVVGDIEAIEMRMAKLALDYGKRPTSMTKAQWRR